MRLIRAVWSWRIPVGCALGLLSTLTAAQRVPPLSIDQLPALLARATPLEVVRPIDGAPTYRASLVAYTHGGLRLQALVAEPLIPAPPAGFPVLLANHGFHPDPPRYGITREGRDWRPGDYYRPVPQAYAAAGFVVVMPDYRGHSDSTGREYTGSLLSSAWYTEDVLVLLAALPGLAPSVPVDLANVFLWGHSLGGEVTLRALLAAPAVRGAALWSTVGGDVWEQAWRLSRRERVGSDTSLTPKPAIERLRRDIAGLAAPYDTDAREPLLALQRLRTPLILQHADGDASTDVRGSMRIAQELARRDLPYELHVLPGADHFFQGPQFEAAVARDVAFFRRLMSTPR